MAIEHSIEYYRSHLIEMAGRVKSMMDKCGNADHKKQLAELYEHILGVLYHPEFALAAAPAKTMLDGDLGVCSGCDNEVDYTTCGCGDSRIGHGNPMDVGHSFVPLGCDCLRS